MRSEAACMVIYADSEIEASKGYITIDPDMAMSGMFSAYQFSVWFLVEGMPEIKPNKAINIEGTDYAIIKAEKDPYGARWQVDVKAIDG